jgi:hypothetical protein
MHQKYPLELQLDEKGPGYGVDQNIPAKAFSLPVMIIAPISLLSSYLERASFSSLNRGLERALRALGRLRVTITMASVSTRYAKIRGSVILWTYSSRLQALELR